MNNVVAQAMAKVRYRNNYKGLREWMDMATGAAQKYGVLNGIAIHNRLLLKQYIDGLNYLTKQEQRALFYWCAAEFTRLQEVKNE